MISLKAFFLAFIGATLLMNLAIFLLNRRVEQSDWTEERNEGTDFMHDTSFNSDQEQCVLPQIDPWDPTIAAYLDPQKDPLRGCDPTFEVRSFLDADGNFWIRGQTGDDGTGVEETCHYRRVHSIDGRHLKFSPWIRIAVEEMVKPGFDVFEVECTRADVKTYRHLHAQIVPQRDDSMRQSKEAPDVHIILIDATSHSHLLRTMPNTVHFLRTELQAVSFSHLNRVAVNSRPNSYALLMGERAEDLDPSPWGPYEEMPGRDEEICQNPVERENLIFYDFQRAGYRTMWMEDWWDGTSAFLRS